LKQTGRVERLKSDDWVTGGVTSQTITFGFHDWNWSSCSGRCGGWEQTF